jgi:DHA1 family bicyclomycin/chloramphenicol resistance-like MFS transporter
MTYPIWLPVLLGFLTAVGPVSTDMYLPAFPAIEAALGGQAGTAQATLAAWFAGLAVGQITQGTLSDRFGRRWPLVIGTAVFTLASVGCALAPDLATLSAWRLVAALGGSASMVIPRAIVRDLADGHAAARLMSRLMLVMGAAPILAPSLGGLVLAFAGWQAIFWICAGYGALCCLLVALLLPDTLAANRRVRLGPGGMLRRYGAILRERGFLTHSLAGGFATFGMFAYLGGSPGVFEGIYRFEPAAYGALFGACAIGLIACSQINPMLVRRFGGGRVLRGGVRLMLVSNSALLAVAVMRPAQWWLVAAPIFVTMSGNGLVMPNSTVGALSGHAAHAGSASALMGTLQFVLGAISGLLVGIASDGTARPMAALMFIGALGAVIGDAGRPRRA